MSRSDTSSAPISEPLDFEAERDAESESWERARPGQALIERMNLYGWRVTLPGGEAHHVALGRDHGAFVGWCDCNGYRYHDGPCAHLCTIRKAAFVSICDVRGERVEIPDDTPAVPDGGVVEAPAGIDRGEPSPRDEFAIDRMGEYPEEEWL